MNRKVVSGRMLTLLLISMLTLAFNIQTVRASGTIYIRPDGSVEGTDKIQRDGDVYTFTDNIYDEIVVEIDNILVDGAGYTLQGTGSGTGIGLSYRNNVTIKNMEIKAFIRGMRLLESSNNTIYGNNITNNRCGIRLVKFSDSNSLSGNNITNNYDGIGLLFSSKNTISGNNIANNYDGISLSYSSKNTISGNSITNNIFGIQLGGFYSNNNSIFGNNITANSVGIRLSGRCSNNTIYGNTIDGIKRTNYVTPHSAYYTFGISLSWSSNNTISGNNITNNSDGISLSYSSKNTISGNNIANNYDGISLLFSSKNTISGNNIANNYDGISLLFSSKNTISGNNITNNRNGIWLGLSNYNSIFGNNITNNEYGTRIGTGGFKCSNNTIYHNNLINNERQVYVYDSANVWDDGYPSGGNYWGDYSNVDLYSGPYQNITGSDGIWDHPYVIDANNRDNYPLVEPWSPKPPSPIEALEELIQIVESWNLDTGIENSLTSKLQATRFSLDKENQKASIGQLTAFINKVEALRGKKLTNEQADCLVSEAQRIIDLS